MKLRRISTVAAGCTALVVPVLGTPPAAHAAALQYIQGTADVDRLRGTNGPDLILAHEGDDRVWPLHGRDRVRAGKGDDYVFLTDDGEVDRIYCGPGFDVVAWNGQVDQLDLVDDNCEGRIA